MTNYDWWNIKNGIEDLYLLPIPSKTSEKACNINA